MKRPLLLLLLAGGCSGSIRGNDGEPGPGEPGPSPGGSPAPMSNGGSGATVGMTPALPGPGMPGPGMPPAAGDDRSVPGSVVVAAECKADSKPGAPPRVWRLSAQHYARTVDSLFAGRSKDGNRDLPKQPVVAPFGAINDSDRFSTQAESYFIRDGELRDAMAAAEDVAGRLVSALAANGGCVGQTAGFAECMGKLVRDRGELLFRRPLTDAEVTKYASLATGVAGQVGPRPAAELAFRAMLMAPQFLYRSELGAPIPGKPSLRRLTPFEVATAISYSLTEGPPDAPLWDAAKAGMLADPAVIAAHVARLANAPANLQSMNDFVHQYFAVDHAFSLDKKAPYNANFITEDTTALIKDIITTNARKDFITALLTTDVVFAEKRTAPAYGVTNTSFERRRFVLPAGTDRVGLLGQPSWLWTFAQPERTDVPKRGLFVREALLCGEIPPFDASLVQPLSKDPALTMRQKLVKHQVDPSCTGCHALLDPIGLGLEGYDHLGMARTMEAGKPVDTSGRLVGSGDQDGAFNGLRELAQRLAKSRTVTRCFAATSLQYWLGRRLSEGDECGVSAMEKAYAESGGDYVKALQALFTSESFLTKRP